MIQHYENASIAAAGVSFAYADGPPVLRDVSLRIERGRVTGIIGPNGSGKSTLLRLVAGVARPTSGRVTFEALAHQKSLETVADNALHRESEEEGRDGETTIPLRGTARLLQSDIYSMPSRERAKRLAYLPQSVSPLFGLTVEETVALGRFPHAPALGGLTPRDTAAIEEAMARTGVTALRKRVFTELSGGERQRALLASVLAQGPEFLLLDEPTASLDLHHESEVFALLCALAKEGYGVCVVTHDLALAAGHCDELLLLSHEGAPVSRGLPPDVLTAEALSAAYGATVRVGTHPFTGAPLPYAPPGEQR